MYWLLCSYKCGSRMGMCLWVWPGHNGLLQSVISSKHDWHVNYGQLPASVVAMLKNTLTCCMLFALERRPNTFYALHLLLVFWTVDLCHLSICSFIAVNFCGCIARYHNDMYKCLYDDLKTACDGLSSYISTNYHVIQWNQLLAAINCSISE